ncbi:MAG: outer membrane lipid asymmetry maintenance protein MlaD [Gammaproteobacteria bacterium RIFCSPLOWO2_02_FULL_47_50]|jgi:phospholipid/cholesterol/gamma-HCH transport system substrate-binding protein|nr:MAG: outer membrane lipid asymmetry maintenance protein MlaD [Gammaproteobacteria bacterium RIFCSPLOWO2_02_47_7]OGT66120.1 MAG: outer membrane lipid asymmetry maintenance protein MlaD [Gammaproteobacteria bacterium RIFCSPLOWO2_01_FULL_47_190]OGT75362.1 MAG: outer membrane lipid asymmetry maintenance protein MlaD [Gammaproteobacteria bacterium RIFCSPLOWO2_12_47_11]OGT81757.1 MAG: outer membrane lipid asymmetry maintenance protein MlaD [Gammaproteobacteria bacterium RIFCSPLOWO2_02_FULL_47_50]O
MTRHTLEIWVGVFVAAGIAALFVLAMKVSNLSTVTTGDTYKVTARFDNIGGLSIRSPVKASGVLVGRVSNIAYDDKTYSAIVTLSIQQNFNQFPADSRASIYTAGLLGEQYIELLPGAEDDYLKDGDRLLMADSAMILEQMIGRIIADKISE